MKKGGKLSPKEKRQQEQERKRQAYKNAEASKAAAEPTEAEVVKFNLKSGEASGQPGKNKSPAKAAGVKSIFTLPGGELLMTSFGQGNQARLEKRVDEGEIFSLAAPPVFEAEARPRIFAVHGANGIDAKPYDPRCTPSDRRGNLIDTKAALEQRFFGRTFNDNIHIQLIYNILDVEKILAVYINSIIYELNNIFQRDAKESADDTELYDLFKSLNGRRTYQQFLDDAEAGKKPVAELAANFEKLIRMRQLAYYPDAFYNRIKTKDKDKEGKITPKPEEEIYYILSLLGMTRQAMAHGDAAQKIYQELDGKSPMFDTLDKLYENRVKALDDGFLKMSEKNIAILIGAMGAKTREDKEKVVRRYYDFVVRKEHKNFGFSTKKLRERILAMTDAVGNPLVLDEDKKPLTDKKYDTVRGKMYKAIDFIIYCHYRDDMDEAKSLNRRSVREWLVEALRRCLTETEKEQVYQNETRRLWKAIRDAVLLHVVPFMQKNGEKIADIQPDPDVNDDMLTPVSEKEKGRISAGAEEVTRFSKLMSLLTLFLDGKEINDLLSTLVNKFENIASFRRVLIELQKLNAGADNVEKIGLVPAYAMFERDKIAEELNDIRSFARMRQPDAHAKRIMFVEAAELLGAPGTEEELTAYWDEKLSKTNDAGVTRDKGFRNFIASNVISSSRFQYLIRYNAPRQARMLAENPALIAFVLRDITDEQITRYYNSAWDEKGNEAHSPDAMREYLTQRLTSLNFRDFENVKQSNDATREEKADKQRKQALIRLYLTALYLITKNLVYINSRYFMAFQIRERDQILKYGPDSMNRKKSAFLDYLQFAEKAMESVRPCRRVRLLQERRRQYAELHGLSPEDTSATPTRFSRDWLEQDLKNAKECGEHVIFLYRNQVEHLNAIRNAGKYAGDIREITSWYALYHYIMQRILRDICEADCGRNPVSDKLNGYFAAVEKYGTYCKDFVKALNIPFAYNLPRYKNLSVDGLFDRNRPGQPGCGKDKTIRQQNQSE